MVASPRSSSRVIAVLTTVIATVAIGGVVVAPSSSAGSARADDRLDAALEAIVARPDGPPGISAVVQRGESPVLHTAGVGDTTTQAPITLDDSMRLASVAKAFSGAAAWSLIADVSLPADATVGDTLTDMPSAWADVTIVQLLQHTSGIADFSKSPAFQQAFRESLLVAPPPSQLVAYVADEPLAFAPGSRFRYSNTENILVGLMVQAVAGASYEDVLASRVYQPLGLTRTSLPPGPELPTPRMHGYLVDEPQPPEDLTEVFAAGWTWASGGQVSTPGEANAFVRGYVSGETSSPMAQLAQYRFRDGSSEPPGPGTNSAGPGIFRYETRCGTVYGHTGNTAGYTQFIASSRDGKHSTVVSVNSQLTPDSNAKRFKELRKIYGLAVCAAMANGA
jgi:D-alanyl-D-alanine carboxypeptidase